MESESRLSLEEIKANFNSMNLAFAVHKMYYTENGDPCDYEFIEFNKGFEEYIGIPRHKLLGKKVTEIFPDIEKDPGKWIEKYGKVSLTMEPMEFEQFFPPHNKWYRIYAYSVKKGYFSVIFTDVTEKKNLEIELSNANRELVNSNNLLKTIIESAPTPIIGLDLDGIVQYVWNPAAERILKWSAEEAMGKPLPTVPYENKEEFKKFREQIREGLTLNGIEVRRRRGDGSEIDYSIYASPLYDAEDKIVGNIAVLVDVTERKQFENTLKKREEIYRLLFENAGVAVALFDLKGTFLFQNTLSAAYLRGKPEDFIGDNVYDHFSKVEADEYLRRFNLVVELGHGEIFEDHIEVPSGDVWFRTNIQPIKNPDGTTTSVQLITQDITQSKLAEYELASEKERLIVTLRSIGDGVISTDLEGKIQLINKVAEQLTGWGAEEAKGKYINDVLYLLNENRQEIIPTFINQFLQEKNETDNRHICYLQQKDDNIRDVETSFSQILDKDNNIIGIVVVFRDITEKKKIEQELIKTQKLESIGVLAGGIAHDFNNILFSMLGNISVAKLDIDPKSDIYNLLNEVESSVKRAKGLTYQLLTFSKGGSPIKEVFAIQDLIHQATEFTLYGSNIKYCYNIDDELWAIEGDKGQLHQVIQNLVINAKQAMPMGGRINIFGENLQLSPNNQYTLSAGRYVKIQVEDYGIGIPPEYLTRIFDPFFTTKVNGTGLGLAICYSIIKNHGGHIEVSSRVDVGTTLTFILPASNQKAVREQLVEQSPLKGYGRILVMDDDLKVRNVFEKMLTKLGYDVTLTENSYNVISAYKEALSKGEEYHKVILDLTIPGDAGGKYVIKELLKIDTDVKAILASGYIDDPVITNYKDYGFQGVLRKPFDIVELSRIVGNGDEK